MASGAGRRVAVMQVSVAGSEVTMAALRRKSCDSRALPGCKRGRVQRQEEESRTVALGSETWSDVVWMKGNKIHLKSDGMVIFS